jgi:hypothetical protein
MTPVDFAADTVGKSAETGRSILIGSRKDVVTAKAVIALVVGGLIAGCGSDDSETARSTTRTPEATSTPRPASIVGRWELSRTCKGMVESLDQAGLHALAPSIVGDYFPDETPKQLARKADVCEGAKPQQHSHFFTDDGQFGSLDQHEQQVDDAPYSVVDDHTLRLGLEFGDETYRYKIVGNELLLEPVISPRSKREALANPLKFSPALHMAAVAYSGHTWKRVDCGDWC